MVIKAPADQPCDPDAVLQETTNTSSRSHQVKRANFLHSILTVIRTILICKFHIIIRCTASAKGEGFFYSFCRGPDGEVFVQSVDPSLTDENKEEEHSDHDDHDKHDDDEHDDHDEHDHDDGDDHSSHEGEEDHSDDEGEEALGAAGSDDLDCHFHAGVE